MRLVWIVLSVCFLILPSAKALTPSAPLNELAPDQEIESLVDSDLEESSEMNGVEVSDSDLDLEVDENTIKIKEIKEYVSTMDLSKTCLDEALQRRKQLIVKLAISPVTIPLTVASSALGLGWVGKVIGTINNPPGGWGDLAGFVTGLVYGGLGAGGYAITNTTLAAIKLHRLNLIIKSLGEQYLGRANIKTDSLYEFYAKKTKGTELSKSDLIAKLVESDQNGSLCDGSMLKKKKIRIGPKLKFKVANAGDFVKFLNR